MAVAKWLNDNQGVVGVAIFLLTLILGWGSGVFAGLRRRPRFRLSLIPGPTFVCTYHVGQQHNGFEVHRTGVALYLAIANIGSAASSVAEVHVGYHWNLIPLKPAWFKYGIRWFWLTERTAALTDFQVSIGDNLKVYPFLFQLNFLSPVRQETFLDVGRSLAGIVYFEQQDSWGGCQPRAVGGQVRVRVSVVDTFGGRHAKTFSVPAVTLDEARQYNPSFGKTLAEIHGRPLPYDQDA